jgi:hypothetical protein
MRNSVLLIGSKSVEDGSSASWSMNSMVRKLPSTCPTTGAVAVVENSTRQMPSAQM